MEAIVATVIATLAVLGLAHSFGLGHGLIDSYSASRAALGEAQRSMELIAGARITSDTLGLGVHPPTPSSFDVEGVVNGTVQWQIDNFNDPATVDTSDLRLVTLSVDYGPARSGNRIQLTRLVRYR